ncbi:MAG: tetratricopeptide repeat-containing sensor histidine kinase [Bacteroidales bacterium]|nr:tetratricopeptide repeat-containing sensor histidine kinase [Bacteroidales bacterium]
MKGKAAYTFFSILFFFLSVSVSGQTHTTGNLNDSSATSTLDQVKLLSRLCWQNREKHTEKALQYGLEAVKIAKAEGYERELATLYNYIGVIYQDYKYDVPSALTYYDKSLPISLKVNDSIEIAYVYNNLGDAFYMIGNVPLAYEYGKKSLAIFERLNNPRGIAYSYINMGEVNRINQKYDTALVYFRKAIALRQTFNDSVGIASAYLEVAQTLFRMGQTDSAKYYYRVSLAKHSQIDNKNYMAYSMQGMGDVFLKRNEVDSAYIYFDKALKLCQERNNPTGEIKSQLGIAKVMAHYRKEKEGGRILDEALLLAKKSKIIPNILKVYKAQGEFYNQLKDYKKSSENYQDYIHTYDSLFSVLQFQTLSEIKDRFQMTARLNTINEDLRAKQKDEIYSIIIILLLIIFSATLILRNRTIARLSLELKQSNQSKDKIFSIVSHDLIGPFNVLMGTSELLLEDIEEKDLEAAKDKGLLIQRSSEESYRFISNLLQWARTQRDSIKLHKEKFDISQLMHEVKSTLGNQARSKNINVRVNADQNLKVEADKNLIQIVLVNLLNNAIKFTNRDGNIDFTVEKENHYVKVSVKDDGVGIAPERVNLLFKDQTIDSLPGTNNEKGTGLGLLLCKEFVEMHDSEIHVESQVSKGSEFWFTLPLA